MDNVFSLVHLAGRDVFFCISHVELVKWNTANGVVALLEWSVFLMAKMFYLVSTTKTRMCTRNWTMFLVWSNWQPVMSFSGSHVSDILKFELYKWYRETFTIIYCFLEDSKNVLHLIQNESKTVSEKLKNLLNVVQLAVRNAFSCIRRLEYIVYWTLKMMSWNF